jgi:prevent-host-death family protein
MLEVLTANEAQTNFGELLLKTQKAPVQITRSGKLVAVVISAEDYSVMETFKRRYVEEELAHSRADEENGRVADSDVFFADLAMGKYD